MFNQAGNSVIMPSLIQNAIFIPEDNLYLVSSHTHDFVGHTFKDDKEIFVDGGTSYARRGGDLYNLDEAGRYVEYCLTTEDTFADIADKLLWDISKYGDEPRRFGPIKNFDLEKLNHTLVYIECLCPPEELSPRLQLVKRVVQHWIEQKETKSI